MIDESGAMQIEAAIHFFENMVVPSRYLGLVYNTVEQLRALLNGARGGDDMAIKRYTVAKPEQLRALYEIQKDGNVSMDNLARVWRAQNVFESANYTNPQTRDLAYVEFDGKTRRATVYKQIHGNVGIIGRLPYNKAIAYCRENLIREGD